MGDRPPSGYFRPLSRVLTHDQFSAGQAGWVDFSPNAIVRDLRSYPSNVDKTYWGPSMLSSVNLPNSGTHGSATGSYCLKLTTRAHAAPTGQPPAPGSIGMTLKRLTLPRKLGLLQLEALVAFTVEHDRWDLGLKDFRAFGFGWDIQDDQHRYMAQARFLNSADSELKESWQISVADDVSDADWAFGVEGEWARRGIDPQFLGGPRRSGGELAGYRAIPNSRQPLCFNESNDKLNWHYVRLTIDCAGRRFVELEAAGRIFDLSEYAVTLVDRYAGIDWLMNPLFWVETDTHRRAFLYIDSVCLSVEDVE